MLFYLLMAGALALQGADEEAVLEYRVIVHATNPVEALPRETVARMFRRQESRWRDWDGEPRVEPVDQRINAEVRVSFTRKIHGQSLQALRSYWQRKIFTGRGVPPPMRDSDEEVIDFVGRMSGGIGYVAAGTPLPETVRELTVEY